VNDGRDSDYASAQPRLLVMTQERLLNMSTSSRISPLSSLTLAFALLAAPAVVEAQRPVELAPNAPRDRPVTVSARCQLDAMHRAIEPLVAQARATYPDAKRRFQLGLPRGQTFFVTVQLRDSLDREEQVFVAVDSIVNDTVAGRIWSPVQVVSGY
jgi:hypothetical protein